MRLLSDNDEGPAVLIFCDLRCDWCQISSVRSCIRIRTIRHIKLCNIVSNFEARKAASYHSRMAMFATGSLAMELLRTQCSAKFDLDSELCVLCLNTCITNVESTE